MPARMILAMLAALLIPIPVYAQDINSELKAAAQNSQAEQVKALLEAGVDVDAKDEDGMTALMWAAFGGSAETVQVLLDAGADVSLEDKQGTTARTWAAGTEIRQLLQNSQKATNSQLIEAADAILAHGDLRAQQVVYDRYVKVTLPSGWIEKRAWEMTTNIGLPLYNRQQEAVVFINGLDNSDIDPALVKGLAEGDGLKYGLDILLSGWPGEAIRFYAMVSGGSSVSRRPGAVEVGPSLNAARIRYLGKVKVGSAEVELVEWLSEKTVDRNFSEQLRLRSEFIGQKAQILLGQGVFPSTGGGYLLIACRFVASENGWDWIKPLAEMLQPVPESEQSKATTVDRVRALIRSALESTQDNQYSQALDQLKQALELSPEDENALDMKGAILVRQKNYTEAENSLRKAVAINPDHESAHYNLGMALLNQGKKDEAIRELQTVLRITSLYPGVEQILAKLK